MLDAPTSVPLVNKSRQSKPPRMFADGLLIRLKRLNNLLKGDFPSCCNEKKYLNTIVIGNSL